MSVETAIEKLKTLRACCCPFVLMNRMELDDLIHELDNTAPRLDEDFERFILRTMCIGLGIEEVEVCSATAEELRETLNSTLSQLPRP